MGTSDSIKLEYGVSEGIFSGSSKLLKRKCLVRRAGIVNLYGPAGSRSSKKIVIATCASFCEALRMQQASWLVMSGAGPWLFPGMYPSGIAHLIWPIDSIPITAHKQIAVRRENGLHHMLGDRAGDAAAGENLSYRLTTFPESRNIAAPTNPQKT
jgi:hypothetical protein